MGGPTYAPLNEGARVTRIEQAAAAVDVARAWLADPEALALAPDAEITELLARVAELSRLVDAQQVRLAAEVAERSSGPADAALCRRLGHRSAKSCIASAFGLRSRQAAELLALAAATTATVGFSGADVPARFLLTAAALTDGELSLAQAQAIVQTLEPAVPRADPDELAWAERALVEAAADPQAPLVPELITVQARAYAAVLDPDGVLPDAERQRAMRSLRIGRRTDGMWQITMVCPPEQGAAIKAVLDAHLGPRVPVRFHDPDASSHTEGDGAGEQAVTDDRTPEQLRHDVLLSIVQAHAASGDAPTAGGEAPTLVITGTIEALRASLDGVQHRERFARVEHTGDLVPTEQVTRLLCDAAVQVAVTNGSGHVLALGRSQRLFSRAQRRALAARDGGCRAPGCGMPPSWCEAHHVLPWLQGGPTDVDNGILACAYHHHEVHAGRLRVERASPEAGSWRVVSQLQPSRRRSRAAASAGAVGGVAACHPARSLTLRLPDRAASGAATRRSTSGPGVEPRGAARTGGGRQRGSAAERCLRRALRARPVGSARAVPVDHGERRLILRT